MNFIDLTSLAQRSFDDVTIIVVELSLSYTFTKGKHIRKQGNVRFEQTYTANWSSVVVLRRFDAVRWAAGRASGL